MAARQYLRMLTPPKGTFFLYRLRGVGKSTWARETFPDAHIVDLLDLTTCKRSINPGRLQYRYAGR